MNPAASKSSATSALASSSSPERKRTRRPPAADALAIAAHTGRGPFLSVAVRAEVTRSAVDTGAPVVVGVGGRGESTADVAAEAAQAAELGASGVLVFPGSADPVAHHEAVWRASGLPMLVFDLYTRPYPTEALATLLRHPGIAGVKVARLHDAIACPGRQEYATFVVASARLDRLAEATFTEPMEGYVQRMLWIAAAEGRIPDAHAVDPYGPALSEQDRRCVMSALRNPAAS